MLMDNVVLIIALSIVAISLALISFVRTSSLAAKFAGKQRTERDCPRPATGAEPAAASAGALSPAASASGLIGPELVAVIAAAIAVASGAAPGSFRVASIAPAQDAGGFNTPVWGRIERLTRN